jgi:hypothetical protein
MVGLWSDFPTNPRSSNCSRIPGIFHTKRLTENETKNMNHIPAPVTIVTGIRDNFIQDPAEFHSGSRILVYRKGCAILLHGSLSFSYSPNNKKFIAPLHLPV